ncbi:MAG TPA: sugar ABC transporter permease [Actinotalea sp.]|nr:sugar ABC transporter permease [Actinotalea sp.]
MLIGFTVFGWWPILRGVLLSFQTTNLITSQWTGLTNIRSVLADPLLWQAVQNTALYSGIAILIGFPIPLLAAATIAELRGRLRQVGSVLAFLPVVVPPVVAILLWRRFYAPEGNGLINTIIGWFGLGPVGWLMEPAWAMPSLVVAAIWASAGSTIIIYLAAMVTIDRSLYDAAEVDGSGIFRKIWHIMLPQLRGTILVMLLLTIIGVFQVFTEPYLLTGGGPENRTLTLLMLVFRRFQGGDYGGASALSLLLAGVLALLSWIYLRVTRRWAP